MAVWTVAERPLGRSAFLKKGRHAGRFEDRLLPKLSLEVVSRLANVSARFPSASPSFAEASERFAQGRPSLRSE